MELISPDLYLKKGKELGKKTKQKKYLIYSSLLKFGCSLLAFVVSVLVPE